jgi:two-component sensor histidine kinase
MTINEANFDLYRLLNDVENMFQLKANDKGLHLLFERTPEVPQYVRTDEVKLRQVLINLLSNAIKFTKAGRVSVRVSVVSGQWSVEKQRTTDNGQRTLQFEVEDTGSGIAPDELDSIFKAFVQAKATQKFQEGTGLGLTIARSFVQLMGGDINVSSQLGKGTVFEFNIPVSRIESVGIKSQQPTSRISTSESNQQSDRAKRTLRDRTSITDVLTPAALATLPPDLIANLHQAILALDIERIETCIAQIREVNAPVAGAIAVLAKGFKYKQLLALMQPTTD